MYDVVLQAVTKGSNGSSGEITTNKLSVGRMAGIHEATPLPYFRAQEASELTWPVSR